MKPDQAAALRAPFDPSHIGKLPRVTCGECRDSRSRNCDKHPKSKCSECGSWISSDHMHLDYVGHADITDRLLQVDPEWTWEPMALDQQGLPALDANGGLWIRLTVAGVTRLGYGDADGKRGGNAIKESIGDALRNAAMRFGVGLDLWRKEALDESSASPSRTGRVVEEQGVPSDAAIELFTLVTKAEDRDALSVAWSLLRERATSGEITAREADQLKAHWTKRRDALTAKVSEVLS